MQIAQSLSGFTAGEADILRKAMGKKKRTELEKQKERLIENSKKEKLPKLKLLRRKHVKKIQRAKVV